MNFENTAFPDADVCRQFIGANIAQLKQIK